MMVSWLTGKRMDKTMMEQVRCRKPVDGREPENGGGGKRQQRQQMVQMSKWRMVMMMMANGGSGSQPSKIACNNWNNL